MQLLTQPVDLDRLADLCRRDEFFWLDLDNPELEEVEAVGHILGLHPLAVEDTQEFCQRPKVETYGDQVLLVYFGATLADGVPEPVEVHLHISGSFVVTVHREPCARFDDVRRLMPRRPPESEHRLVYRVLDALTDAILDVLDSVAERVDAYEEQVYARPRARDRDAMAMLRRDLGDLRRVLFIQRQVFARAVEEVSALRGLEAAEQPYYRDVGDHLARALDEVDGARDSLRGMLETYTNEVQERLTIVATIFLPLTMLTGFFGMNFNWLIGHIGSAATFFGLGIGGMATAAAGIVVWLKRTGLLQRRGRRRAGQDP